MKRILLVLLFLLLVASFFAFDLERFMTLESLKQSQSDFAALKVQSPWLVVTAGFVLYVIAAALVIFASRLGLTVSTTHVLAGAIMSVVVTGENGRASRTAKPMLLARFVTAPVSVLLMCLERVITAYYRSNLCQALSLK